MASSAGGQSPEASRLTLQRHILERQRRHMRATGELSKVLIQLAYAAKIFAHALAPPPLSRQIQDLEREIGFLLFDRLPRGT
jgi:hypothetical protein